MGQPPMDKANAGRFVAQSTPLNDLLVLQRLPIGDNRGFLERLFCSSDLAPWFDGEKITQINHTLSVISGTIRGMHFQVPPHSEIKIVSCLRGEVFDVVVDLRAGSPTYLQWFSQILSEDNFTSLFIPKGFAHGFQTLTSNCELIYFHSAPYNAEAERGLNATDPALAISWPEKISERSDRDKNFRLLSTKFQGLSL